MMLFFNRVLNTLAQIYSFSYVTPNALEISKKRSQTYRFTVNMKF